MNSIKHMLGLLGVVLGIFVLTGCGSTAYIQKDNSYNFNKIRSYAWVNGTQKARGDNVSRARSNDLVDRKIRDKIDERLQSGGWVLDNRRPDVLLVYDVDVQRENRNVSNPVYSMPSTRWFFNPYARRYVPVYYPSQFLGYDNATETVRESTLTLTMMDADTDKTIWQGWTTTEMNGRVLSDKEIAGNVKAILKKLDK
ncbi:DUF4136 domain-containing protein [Sediminibacterium soli]|uniref:DUF4136 domain-containing protein n=1 Tax=Sediminibacterium soli TaxID=2698829 RepID=UPI001379BBC8|nr:DUF4136 domain-containing protein [Sediminibacterium soli]NCI47862.1 DUF4136 domain-containing protein [Sediminibacterium soli]